MSKPDTTKGPDMPSVHIAIAYYSGYGHTLEIAKPSATASSRCPARAPTWSTSPT